MYKHQSQSLKFNGRPTSCTVTPRHPPAPRGPGRFATVWLNAPLYRLPRLNAIQRRLGSLQLTEIARGDSKGDMQVYAEASPSK